MPLFSTRLLVPIALLVVGWGGLHLLGGHGLTVTPAVLPGAIISPPVPPSPATALPLATPSSSPSAAGRGAIPVLPGALQELNRSTGATAVGLYALVQQLEQAVRDHLEQLARQLEPGRG